jgi:hypothetical protein
MKNQINNSPYQISRLAIVLFLFGFSLGYKNVTAADLEGKLTSAGQGVVVFYGLAKPVRTPLIGPAKTQ